MLIVTPTRRAYMLPERSGRPELLPTVHEVCGTSDLEMERGYAKHEIVGDDRSLVGSHLGISERPVSIREM
jgi:hypothetical protein